MKNKVVFLIISFFLVPTVFPQRSNETDSKNQVFLNDSSKLSIYLSYLKTGKRKPRFTGESEQGIWLELRNNTKWGIRFCDGGFEKENDANLAFYQVEVMPSLKEEIKIKNLPAGYQITHVCMMKSLNSGESYVFSVPKEHLIKGLMIKIKYQYEWEKLSSSEPDHFVYYFSTALPN